MNRTAATVATILTTAVLAVTTGGAAQAATHVAPSRYGLPLCISTTWASHYYGLPKTAKGTACYLPMRRVFTPGTSSNVYAYDYAWTPASWSVEGYFTRGDRSVAVYVLAG